VKGNWTVVHAQQQLVQRFQLGALCLPYAEVLDACCPSKTDPLVGFQLNGYYEADYLKHHCTSQMKITKIHVEGPWKTCKIAPCKFLCYMIVISSTLVLVWLLPIISLGNSFYIGMSPHDVISTFEMIITIVKRLNNVYSHMCKYKCS